MERTAEAIAVERELEIAASPETVWEFFVDPDKAGRWMGIDAVLEPHPGGRYRVVVIPGHIALGEFVELDPPHRIVWTWGWEQSGGDVPSVAPGESTIEVELTPIANGTRVRFVHKDLPSAASADAHAHGWDHYLERLTIAAAGRDAGADPWVENAP